MKKLLNKENILTLIFILVALHPIYELDWCFNGVVGPDIPIRLSTLINFIVLPLLVIVVFVLFEKNKKKVLIGFGIYAIVFCIYFVLHLLSARTLIEDIHLSYTFLYYPKDEIVYTVTLLLPLVYVYVFNFADIKEKMIENISLITSMLISLPIIISNIFGFGLTTYRDELRGNIFDWFKLPFDSKEHHPRRYATAFFFKEGNTIGILLVMLLVFQYYFLIKEKNKKKKVLLLLSIVFSTFSMLILGTRVATYGAIIVPIAVLVLYLIYLLLKKETLNKIFICVSVLMIVVSSIILPYSPAYQNQLFDASDYSTLKLEDSYRAGKRQAILNGAEGFEPFSAAWVDYYVYVFDEYKFLANVTPSDYYEYYYDYHVDPKFWVDLVFDYELEERVNTRQVETIFYKYKWNNYMTLYQKLFGFTFGIFMRGGINIERDFIQQFYSYGYLGFPLVMGPWLVLFGYVIYLFIKRLFEKKVTLYQLCILMSIGLGVVSGIISGHTFDELSTSMIISLLCVLSIKQVKGANNE